MEPTATQDITVQDLPFFEVQVSDVTLGSQVARIFEGDHSLPGVVVMQEETFRGMVSRNQFFQRLGRLFGIEVYSTRPITSFLDSLPVAPLVLPADTTIQNAAIFCLARPVEYVYDPFIVSMADGTPRLIDFLALILKQTELLTAAQIEAFEQKAAAIAASSAKSDFLANMSHELRTPLTAIIGYGEILHEDAIAGRHGEMIPRLKNIIDAGVHLLEMINGILDLSKIEARKADLFLTTFSLPDLLQEVVGTVTPLVQKNRNRFELVTGNMAVEMHSDETKLRQCLLNLLSNAAKFARDGRIVLTVGQEKEEEADWVVFSVSDTGIGMSEDQMKRLFEPFYQVDSSISRRFGGTGLGLSLTKQFCEMLGGTLSVESILDQGTTFTMKLPLKSKKLSTDTSSLSPA